MSDNDRRRGNWVAESTSEHEQRHGHGERYRRGPRKKKAGVLRRFGGAVANLGVATGKVTVRGMAEAGAYMNESRRKAELNRMMQPESSMAQFGALTTGPVFVSKNPGQFGLRGVQFAVVDTRYGGSRPVVYGAMSYAEAVEMVNSLMNAPGGGGGMSSGGMARAAYEGVKQFSSDVNTGAGEVLSYNKPGIVRGAPVQRQIVKPNMAIPQGYRPNLKVDTGLGNAGFSIDIGIRSPIGQRRVKRDVTDIA